MNLSAFKAALNNLDKVTFSLPDGTIVPPHFHVTEIGLVHRHFIDCGGTERHEHTIVFQLFTATDYDHRLSVEKLKSILELSEKTLSLQNAEIQVEYQGVTIEKYDLGYSNDMFQLLSTQTDCLAKDKCGIPEVKPKVSLSHLQPESKGCIPGSGCC
jgi:hypothetical protein